MIVQIAGIKTIKDANMCAGFGADYVGLLVGKVHESRDFITVAKAKAINGKLPENCRAVMITHLSVADDIISTLNETGIRVVQLHSYIKESEVKKIKNAVRGLVVWRLIHIDETGKILTDINNLVTADAYFIDSINRKTNQVGGTGLVHDWNISAGLVGILKKPVILAGGLNPQNVQQAISVVKPYGVDVNTGVRAPDKSLNPKKVKLFIKKAKET